MVRDESARGCGLCRSERTGPETDSGGERTCGQKERWWVVSSCVGSPRSNFRGTRLRKGLRREFSFPTRSELGVSKGVVVDKSTDDPVMLRGSRRG